MLVSRSKGWTRGFVIRCQYCGNAFVKENKGGRLPQYCVEACRRAAKLDRDRLANPRRGIRSERCKHCGKEFAYSKSTHSAFCGRTCETRSLIASNVPRRCKTCGEPIVREIGRGKDRIYCSAACVPRREDAGHGYIGIFTPDHPLANKDGWQFEHRVVLFDAIGPGWHPCHYCGTMLTWSQHYRAPLGLGVDHVDRNRSNNSIDNLVPCCLRCNNKRRIPRRPAHFFQLRQGDPPAGDRGVPLCVA